ncbi:MAG: DUF2059 domain-containing protein [Oleispira sp.]|nr:DUF2059 domain-containing protein [Oleispira sp.]
MNKIFVLLVTLTCASFSFATAPADESTLTKRASAESVKELMDKTGTGEMAIQAMNQMLPVIKKMVPGASDQFWVEFMKEVKPEDLVTMIIPIYQKHFSQEDIDAVNAFYDTKAGQNFISSQPLIMRESMIVGQAWSQAIVQKVIAKAQAVKQQATAE